MKTLRETYDSHQGKVSDKWTLYLNVYEHLLRQYKQNPVNLLEIGVQNGGSLEIWSEYFSNATTIVGCDINPECGNLKYNDSKIKVVTGDANTPEVYTQIYNCSQVYDIIIDDGSHTSADIIKSFSLYYPLVKSGGLYIAEDLHCSYYSNMGGGLWSPHSSMTFFKSLADIINSEHWGDSLAPDEFISEIATKYALKGLASELDTVFSVQFFNSLCVISKRTRGEVGLGIRLAVGSEESVVPGTLAGAGHGVFINPSPQSKTESSRQLLSSLTNHLKVLNSEVKQAARAKRTLISLVCIEALTMKVLKAGSMANTIKVKIEAVFNRLLRALLKCTSPVIKTARKAMVYARFGSTRLTPWLLLFLHERNTKPLKRGQTSTAETGISNLGLVYIARGATEEDIHSIHRFLEAYRKNPSGCEHTLYVAYKGFADPKKREEVEALFRRVPHTACDVQDDGYDLGAYMAAASTVKEDYIAFLNTHSEPVVGGWLAKLVDPLVNGRVGLSGCTGSFESMRVLSEEFPPKPNPHIRTNGFAISKALFTEAISGRIFNTKMDCWQFESGYQSLTRIVQKRGLTCAVADKEGNTYVLERSQAAKTFRDLFVDNVLVADNQTRLYWQSRLRARLIMSYAAWSRK